MTGSSARWLLGAAVLAVALIGGIAWVGSERDPSAESPPTAVKPAWAAAADSPASDVLRGWDRRRAAAYASGDVSALRGLYVAGARAAGQDLRMLRAYTRRGLHVEGMRMQLLEVQVLVEKPDRYQLRVTDRLVGAVAVGSEARWRLPRDKASTRVITLERTSADAPWLVAAVRAPSGSGQRRAAR